VAIAMEAAERASAFRPLPFGDCLLDHGTNRPLEITTVIDAPCIIEPHHGVGSVDHGFGWDRQSLQGCKRQAPVSHRIRYNDFIVGLG
jgi:hypothetical protein